MNMDHLTDENWRTQAACRDQGDLWFADDRDTKKLAVDVCVACPVRQRCYVEAVENDERFGIWGGIDFSDKARARRGAA